MQGGNVESEFYQRLVLFYYKYLLHKYFTQLKNAKHIVARFAFIGKQLKESKRRQILPEIFAAFKREVSESKEIQEQANKVAFSVLIAPVLKNMKHHKQEMKHKETLIRNFRQYWAFKRFREGIEYQRQAIKRLILADRFHYQYQQRKCLKIMKNLKAIKQIEEKNRETKIDKMVGRKTKAILEKGFAALSLNAWVKFIPYRQVLRNSKKLMVMRILYYNACQSKLVTNFMQKRITKIKKEYLEALKENVKKQQLMAKNFMLIQNISKLLRKKALFSLMKAKAQRSISLGKRLDSWNIKKNKSILHQVLHDWILVRRAKVIERQVVPMMKKKALISMIRKKIEESKSEALVDQKIRRFRYLKLLKFLVFLLQMNRDIMKEKKQNTAKADIHWKSVVFSEFVSKLKEIKRLKKKGQKISENNLLIKFRVWRDKTLGVLAANRHSIDTKLKVFVAWRNSITDRSALAVCFNEKLGSHLKAACFYALRKFKDASINHRYKLLQALTFERCSAKRKVFALIKSAGEKLLEIDNYVQMACEKSLKSEYFQAWKVAFQESILVDKTKKSINRKQLKDYFDAWVDWCKSEKQKAKREREAGHLYWKEKKKELILDLITRALEKRSRREREVLDAESIKKKRALGLAKNIGNAWLERARKRIKERISLRFALKPIQDFSKPESSINLREAFIPVNKPSTKTEACQTAMEDYLQKFRSKRRLEPTTRESRSDQAPPTQLPPSSTKYQVAELESLLQDYRIKTQLLEDTSLPFSLRQQLLNDQEILKQKIKFLYATARNN